MKKKFTFTFSMTPMRKGILISLLFFCCCLLTALSVFAQSPEISLREFASGQIKKGVRSIGMGGDGATWGNYSLVWRDTGTALVDAGSAIYSNKNAFSFTAVGVTTPNLWHGLAIYAIALSQYASNIATSLKAPGLGSGSVPVHGDGTNQSLFVKAAMPLGKGFSFGVLLSYERSQFNALADSNSANYVRYQTDWLPSGGFGASWQPSKRILLGFRAIFNHDWERRIDNHGTAEGMNATQEYRIGISVGVWKGGLIDIGGNIRYRYNQISNTKGSDPEPNMGFEQNLWNRHLALRAGLDESSQTGGFSIRFRPIVLDVAYVHDLGLARFGTLFGTNSNSIIATFVFDYEAMSKKKK